MDIAEAVDAFRLARANDAVNKFWGHWVALMLRGDRPLGVLWSPLVNQVATLNIYSLSYPRTQALPLFKCIFGFKRVIPVLLPIHNSVTRTSPSFRHLGVELRHVVGRPRQDALDQPGQPGEGGGLLVAVFKSVVGVLDTRSDMPHDALTDLR